MPIRMKQNLAFSFFCLVSDYTDVIFLFTIHWEIWKLNLKTVGGHLDRGDHDEELVIRDLAILVLVRKAEYQIKLNWI